MLAALVAASIPTVRLPARAGGEPLGFAILAWYAALALAPVGAGLLLAGLMLFAPGRWRWAGHIALAAAIVLLVVRCAGA